MSHPSHVMYFTKSLAGALLLLCQEAISADDFGPRSGVQCFLVEKASISPMRREKTFGRANAGHQITRGSKMVLAVRAYEDTGRGPDSQSFKKATLEFGARPDLAPGQERTVPVQRSYYSEGASGFVDEGGYAWASNPFSQFQLIRTQSGLSARFDAHVETTVEFPKGKRYVTVTWGCPITDVSVEQLDPWQGRVGTSFSSFYPRLR